MIHISLPDRINRRLPFYLAMEEWVAASLPPDDYFFTWQVSPTVIFGRNQCIDTEVNLGYCNDNGIEFYRRKSGGGCMFADMHNIMFSYITPSETVAITFSRYTGMVADMLRSLGLDASATGRNDIMIDGRKVSGNAFYHIPGRSIVHGTMLYDTDLRHMANAITPSKSKLESKQVQSVASHITTLSEHLDMSIDDFHWYAINHLTDSELTLTDSQVKEIAQIERSYYNPAWIFGRRRHADINLCKRIDGCGEFSLSIKLRGRIIDDIGLEGDFFILSDIDSSLLDRLRGVKFTPEDVAEALSSTDVSQVIAGLSSKQFIDLIFNNTIIS